MLNDELLNTLMSFMIELAVILLILLFSRNKKEQGRKVTRLALIAAAFPLINGIYEETLFLFYFWKYELDGKIVITHSMVLQYVILLVKAILGFFVIFFIHKLLLKISNKKKNESPA